MPKTVTGGGTNSQGNSYTTYSGGGYRYSNTPSSGQPSGSSYYAPTGGTSGFYTQNGGASGGGYSTYTNSSGSRSYVSK